MLLTETKYNFKALLNVLATYPGENSANITPEIRNEEGISAERMSLVHSHSVLSSEFVVFQCQKIIT